MDELDAIRITFFQECDELLADLESGLLAQQRGAGDAETVNAVFRAVHSIKGGAGVFGFDGLVRFAHLFEAVLEGLRSEKLEPTPDLVSLLLGAHDELIDHVTAARTGRVQDLRRLSGVSVRLAEIVDRLKVAALDASPEAATAPERDDFDFDFTPLAASLEPLPAPPLTAPAPPAPLGWTIAFRPLAELYRKANEPAVLLRELARLGEARAVLDLSDLPSLQALDPEDGYLAWTIDVAGDIEKAQVAEVFEFVEGDCDLVISPMGQAAPAAAAPEPQFASEPQAELPIAPPPVKIAPPPLLTLVEPEPAPPPHVEPEPPRAVQSESAQPESPPAEAPVQTPPPQSVIRVDPERVDRLVDLVGELVISQVMLAQKVQEAGLPPSSGLVAGLEELEQLTREIQDGVMAIRAQQVRAVFQRMPRLVREVAALTGKQARLVTDGEATEVDRTVIERLAEPLTHMIRNAIDHGLETPEERAALGKSPEGVIRLSAQHRGARIVIEVSDDGRGIDRRRVLSTAVARGLVAADAQLDDEAIDNLIFLPGFSTASAVSDISGRGVGMDVVRRSVQALGGRIAIASVPGRGATITLSLPLTLAVLDGMQVEVCGQTLVAPLAAIVESVRPRPEDVRRIGSGAVLAVRDSFIPLVDVGVVLGFRDRPINPADGIVLLVETDDGGRVALVADEIHGQRQVVIKSLESNYGQVAGISAATIMGDGRIALIIDIDAVISMRNRPAPAPLLAAE